MGATKSGTLFDFTDECATDVTASFVSCIDSLGHNNQCAYNSFNDELKVMIDTPENQARGRTFTAKFSFTDPCGNVAHSEREFWIPQKESDFESSFQTCVPTESTA